jgi:hypothetical protein
MTLRGSETVRLIIYGDFNCPFSALASARAENLEIRGRAEIDWRAVEHDVAIPSAGEDLTNVDREGFERELSQIRGLLLEDEADRLRMPDKRINTRLATAAYAANTESLRPVFREQLFAAYWTRGEDLIPEVLERFGCGRRDERTTARWRAEWLALPKPIVPMMVLPDGRVSRGLGSLARLIQMVGEPGDDGFDRDR